LNRKILMFAFFVLASVAFLLSVSCAVGQTSTAITRLTPDSGTAGKIFNVTLVGTVNTTGGFYQILLDDSKNNHLTTLANGTASGNAVSSNFAFPSLIPGNYNIVLQDANSSTTNQQIFHVAAEGISAIPIAALLIIAISVGISFINMGLNRALITKLIGWHEYRSMQREMSEFNAQKMAAVRARDDKTLEKLKKKQSQINAMQSKMMKPQFILFGFSLVYLLIWPLLTGYFPFPVAYVPGFGAQPFFIWYLICSFFFGTIAGRVFGITPIQ
jgi:uncharacterized membrane protein (DUF106 family)